MSDNGATVINPGPTTILSLTSAQNGQEYRLFVSLPANYEATTDSYPVLYLFDGNGLYSITRQIAEFLRIPTPPEVPEMIIVGIGYPLPTYMNTLTLRGRDLTFDRFTPEPGDDYPWGETGGAGTFLTIFTDEIIPLIEGRFRVDAKNRSLMGWSAGGMVAHRAVYLRPGLFQRVVVIDAYDEEAARLAAAQPDQPAPAQRLFLGFADELMNAEWTEIVNRHLEIVNASGVRAAMHTFEGENHFSVVPAIVSRGLREVYDEP